MSEKSIQWINKHIPEYQVKIQSLEKELYEEVVRRENSELKTESLEKKLEMAVNNLEIHHKFQGGICDSCDQQTLSQIGDQP